MFLEPMSPVARVDHRRERCRMRAYGRRNRFRLQKSVLNAVEEDLDDDAGAGTDEW
jgi:hypothetical protein